MVATITNSSEEKISKIDQGDKFILLEYDDSDNAHSFIFALTVKKDLTSNRALLRKICTQFRPFFGEALPILCEAKEKVTMFTSFDIMIKNVMNGL